MAFLRIACVGLLLYASDGAFIDFTFDNERGWREPHGTCPRSCVLSTVIMCEYRPECGGWPQRGANALVGEEGKRTIGARRAELQQDTQPHPRGKHEVAP